MSRIPRPQPFIRCNASRLVATAATVATAPVGAVHATCAGSLCELVSRSSSSRRGGEITNLLTGAVSKAALQLEHGATDLVAHRGMTLLVVNRLLLAEKTTARGRGGGGGGVVSRLPLAEKTTALGRGGGGVVSRLSLAEKTAATTALGRGGGGVVSATRTERHGEGGFQVRGWYREIYV